MVRFHKRYYTSVAAGEKTSTIRWRDPITVGPALFVFEDHPDNPVLEADVLSVDRHRLDRLTPRQARLPHGTDMAAYASGLRSHYPDIPPDAEVDVVSFAVTAAVPR